MIVFRGRVRPIARIRRAEIAYHQGAPRTYIYLLYLPQRFGRQLLITYS